MKCINYITVCITEISLAGGRTIVTLEDVHGIHLYAVHVVKAARGLGDPHSHTHTDRPPNNRQGQAFDLRCCLFSYSPLE